MPPTRLLQKFRRLDAYAQNKILDEFRVQSPTGGLVTIVSAIVILMLVIHETIRYVTPVMEPEIVVDGGKTDKLPISFNITFPAMPCYLLGLDIMDEGGQVIMDLEHDVYKVRLDADGNQIDRAKAEELSGPGEDLVQKDVQCGDCYGATPPHGGECCNTCDDVRKAYADMGWIVKEDEIEQCRREGLLEKVVTQAQEGCNIHGKLLMTRVHGNFHFSPGRAVSQGSQHVHDVRTYLSTNHDFRHAIHYLWFGNRDAQKQVTDLLTNPLDNTRWGAADPAMMYQYFLKIVPTQFNFMDGRSLRTFQYSTSRQERNLRQYPVGGLPGVFFTTDFAPSLIIYTETKPPLASFLTGLCAIIGGIFTVASVVDGFLYRTSISQEDKSKVYQ